MSSQHDEQIERLFQKRKQSIVAPEIHIPEKTVTIRPIKSNILGLLVAFIGGGVASFGILAVVSHLAQLPKETQIAGQQITNKTAIDFAKDDDGELTQQAVEKVVQAAKQDLLTPKPVSKPVPKRVAMVEKSYHIAIDKNLTGGMVEQYMLAIKQPELNVEISHQVMPEYPYHALVAGQEGYVKLAYSISSQGQVSNVQVIESKGSNVFEKSAQEALSQWRYFSSVNNVNREQQAQVVFEFSLPK